MFGIGAGEFVVILIVGLIVFGPSKLPEVGQALGKALRAFRKAQAELTATLEESAAEPEKKPVHPTEKVSIEKKPVEENPQPANVTVDEVMNLAKQSPIKTADYADNSIKTEEKS